MIREFKGKRPKISNAIVDELAILIGNVIIKDGANIWPHAMLRADEEEIIIEENVAILEKAFIEAPKKVVIGKNSVISHGAIIHGATIGENVLIGIGAIVLEVNVGKNSIIAAGSVVTKDVEENSFVAGVPAKKLRGIKEEEIKKIKEIVEELKEKARYLKMD